MSEEENGSKSEQGAQPRKPKPWPELMAQADKGVAQALKDAKQTEEEMKHVLKGTNTMMSKIHQISNRIADPKKRSERVNKRKEERMVRRIARQYDKTKKTIVYWAAQYLKCIHEYNISNEEEKQSILSNNDPSYEHIRQRLHEMETRFLQLQADTSRLLNEQKIIFIPTNEEIDLQSYFDEIASFEDNEEGSDDMHETIGVNLPYSNNSSSVPSHVQREQETKSVKKSKYTLKDQYAYLQNKYGDTEEPDDLDTASPDKSKPYQTEVGTLDVQSYPSLYSLPKRSSPSQEKSTTSPQQQTPEAMDTSLGDLETSPLDEQENVPTKPTRTPSSGFYPSFIQTQKPTSEDTPMTDSQQTSQPSHTSQAPPSRGPPPRGSAQPPRQQGYPAMYPYPRNQQMNRGAYPTYQYPAYRQPPAGRGQQYRPPYRPHTSQHRPGPPTASQMSYPIPPQRPPPSQGTQKKQYPNLHGSMGRPQYAKYEPQRHSAQQSTEAIDTEMRDASSEQSSSMSSLDARLQKLVNRTEVSEEAKTCSNTSGLYPTLLGNRNSQQATANVVKHRKDGYTPVYDEDDLLDDLDDIEDIILPGVESEEDGQKYSINV